MSNDMAIAYNMKRRSKKRDEDTMEPDDTPDVPANITGGYSDGGLIGKIGKLIPLAMMAMAEGGEVKEPEHCDDEDDMLRSIMNGRKSSEESSDDSLADFDDNDFEVEPEGDSMEFHETGENSGDEIGDEAEEDDLVASIMKKRRMKP